jgi:hypothetical protein
LYGITHDFEAKLSITHEFHGRRSQHGVPSVVELRLASLFEFGGRAIEQVLVMNEHPSWLDATEGRRHSRHWLVLGADETERETDFLREAYRRRRDD